MRADRRSERLLVGRDGGEDVVDARAARRPGGGRPGSRRAPLKRVRGDDAGRRARRRRRSGRPRARLGDVDALGARAGARRPGSSRRTGPTRRSARSCAPCARRGSTTALRPASVPCSAAFVQCSTRIGSPGASGCGHAAMSPAAKTSSAPERCERRVAQRRRARASGPSPRATRCSGSRRARRRRGRASMRVPSAELDRLDARRRRAAPRCRCRAAGRRRARGACRRSARRSLAERRHRVAARCRPASRRGRACAPTPRPRSR